MPYASASLAAAATVVSASASLAAVATVGAPYDAALGFPATGSLPGAVVHVADIAVAPAAAFVTALNCSSCLLLLLQLHWLLLHQPLFCKRIRRPFFFSFVSEIYLSYYFIEFKIDFYLFVLKNRSIKMF
jgi:hypothetical protein